MKLILTIVLIVAILSFTGFIVAMVYLFYCLAKYWFWGKDL